MLRKLGVAYVHKPGEGAFYGPKLEFVLRDRAGRDWQCGTIQFDLVMPKRFDLRYVDAGGERVHAVMLHRALYGSLERFLGIVLEQHGAALPPWLAPQQVKVLPVSDAQLPYAREVEQVLRLVRLRAGIDPRGESLARRVAEAHDEAVPFIAVVGAREVASRALSLRSRDTQHTLGLEAAVAELSARCSKPNFVG